MIYRLRVVFDSSDDVIRDFEIEQNSNFEQLHFLILKYFGIKGNEPASFFVSDNKWKQGEEIFLEIYDETKNQKLMKDTSLKSMYNESNKFLYIYDYLKLWTFFIEIIEETRKINNVSYPKKIYEFGTLPTKPPNKNFISEDMNNDSLTYDDGDDFSSFY